jgi:cytochrome c oxidase accessory protein FixG
MIGLALFTAWPEARGRGSRNEQPAGLHGMSVEQVESADNQPFYVSAEKIYPQRVHGYFRRIKWALLVITLGVYYLLPFVRWDRGPNAPNQAVLIDLPGRRAYFFFIEIWPQEVYYLTGLLVIAAMTLFLMNAIAGRIWCGYLCPQTVWTDLFLAVERFFEGDRHDRIELDKAPWTANKILRKTGKHLAWLAVAWWTGGAWVLYFGNAPTLVSQLAHGTASFAVYAWIGILTVTTYALAGHMREQVCLYMCPWPRIQAALTDEQALNVTYRKDRGEPRMSLKHAAKARAAGLPAGDCIDCHQCFAVCPTGVDIREGSQLGCIQCGLCIDACDTVMHKVGSPDGLIGYDTDINSARRVQGLVPVYNFIRPRTILYAAVISIVGSVILYSLATRSFTGLDVIHDRNPILVQLSQGGVRNGYTIRFLNKRPLERKFSLSADGLPPGAVLDAQGAVNPAGGVPIISVEPDKTLEVRVTITVPPPVHLPETTDITFRAVDIATGEKAVTRDFFKAPKQD